MSIEQRLHSNPVGYERHEQECLLIFCHYEERMSLDQASNLLWWLELYSHRPPPPRITPIDVIRAEITKTDLLRSFVRDVEPLALPVVPPRPAPIVGPMVQPPQLPPPPVVVLPPPELKTILEELLEPVEVLNGGEEPLPPAIVSTPGRFTREDVSKLEAESFNGDDEEFF